MSAIDLLEKLAMQPNLNVATLSDAEIDSIELEIEPVAKHNPTLTIVAPGAPEQRAKATS